MSRFPKPAVGLADERDQIRGAGAQALVERGRDRRVEPEIEEGAGACEHEGEREREAERQAQGDREPAQDQSARSR